MNWSGWAWVAWLGLFGILEYLGYEQFRGGTTLTYFIEHHVPKFVLAMFCGWFIWHFLISPPAQR